MTQQAPFPLNTWYVACTPEELTEKPLGRTICNKQLVFFRGDENRVAAVEDFALTVAPRFPWDLCVMASWFAATMALK
ncbi:hypothetical protein HSBAA_65180 [Vreelandella sulfidaeris]|uniref:Uncharacterized protein n=1 Tax=Vreelandella sulfidaeris TaxID=115553 RepID=A0A455UFY7_9GAMM|nr:hypothetical protein HSBAA_65180 [Halomonas sulfidaeris]